MITQMNPYLRFDGTAEQAIRLYQSALGAKIETLMRFAEMPGGVPADYRHRIMHSVLTVGALRFMVHDAPPSLHPQRGDNVEVCLEFTDVAEMNRAFDALAQGGTVVMALSDAFFGARFGLVTDAYGVGWMFVGPAAKS